MRKGRFCRETSKKVFGFAGSAHLIDECTQWTT
jgi:hypothetical protein